MGLFVFGLLMLGATFVLSILFKEKIKPILINAIYSVSAIITAIGFLTGMFFYAEPGNKYHVKTLWGSESVVSETGWHVSGFKEPTPWKKTLAVTLTNEADVESSLTVPAYKSRLLDNVDALIDATVRFRIPEDEQNFLKMAREYRTPENLVQTGLLPSIRQTLNATSSLMGAEEYYSGGRTEFNNEFEFQMSNGLYEVKRIERNVQSNQPQSGSANASKGAEQDEFGNDNKTVFFVEKRLDASGTPILNPHAFTDYKIEVVSAVVTDLEPNDAFVKRMESKQKAAADRAIAREQRIQEQEAKELAIAKGQREVAEKQAEALKEQVSLTTKAETEKQLALTEANKMKESAFIAEQTSAINLRKAEIDAKAQMVLADADAYAKKAVIQANNALELKLDAYKFSQEKWAEAYAKRAVPQFMMGSSGTDGNSTGSNQDAQLFQSMLNALIAKDLALDLGVKVEKK